MADKTINQAKDSAPIFVNPQNWVAEYGDFLFSFARMHLGDATIAEEIVQETFLSALRTMSSFEGRSSEKTWLASILRHKIIDYIRKLSRQRRYYEDLGEDREIEDSFDARGHWLEDRANWKVNPEKVLESKDLILSVNSCVALLPEKYRLPFVLREFDEMSTEEICNVLNISSTNLWVMLHRARIKLRKCLECDEL